MIGPFFNDEFGDVFGIVYGITYDGFTPREARDFAETARAEFLRSPDVGKVEIFGDQDEKIYLDFSPQKLANLKLNLDDVLTAIAQQNAVVPSGVINTARENVLVDVTGALLTPQSIANLNLWVNGRFYKLTDIAEVRTGYSDPPTKMFRVNGKPAIGIGVNMASGGNNLTFGKGLHEAAERLMQRLPIGIELNLVSDQPEVVKEAHRRLHQGAPRGDRHRARGELPQPRAEGRASSSPCPFRSCSPSSSSRMKAMDISLQRISLGALIIALGLLVDDAMITIEMMISKIEEGMEKVKAATFAYTSTAFPMLTGTLITIFGFLPIGFADNNTGQYSFSLFAVIAVALVASWFVAVIFAPVIGLVMLPSRMKAHHAAGPGRFMRAFGRVLGSSMRHPLAHDRRLARRLRRLHLRPGLRAAAVLPGLEPAGAPGDDVPAEERLDRGNPGANGAAGEGARERPRHLPLLLLCRRRRHPLLPAARRAARQRLHGGDRGRREGPRSPRPGAGEARDAVRRRLPRRDGPHLASRARTARGLAGAVSGERTDDRGGAGTMPTRSRNVLRASGLVRNVNYDWAEKSKELRIVVDQDRVRQAGPQLRAARPGAQPRDHRLDGHAGPRLRSISSTSWRAPRAASGRASRPCATSRSRRRPAPRCPCASLQGSSTSSTRAMSGAAAACPPSPCRQSRCRDWSRPP